MGARPARRTTTSRSSPRAAAAPRGAAAREAAGSRWRLACFDLDGTLVPGTTVSRFLAERVGQGEPLDELERRYAAGEISNAAVADATGASLAGRELGWVATALEDLPVIRGIGETVAQLRARGIEAIVTTVTWRFAAEALRARYGFAAACGTEMAAPGGVLDGRIARYFDADDKLRFVEGHCASRGIPLESCIAVGDARSDVPLFGAVGFSVALNATAQARAAATVALDTDDLTDVLAVLPPAPLSAR